jgi:hypothetical protein
MFDSVHLTLLIGPLMVPVPAPLPLVEALRSVQVSAQPERTGFQLTFAVGKTSIIQTALLPAGFLDPMITRVVIVVTFRGVPEVLCDGVITRHEVAPSNEAGQSTLTVTGEDLSVLMNVVENPIPYPALPDPGKVMVALSPYLMFGIVPMIIPPPVTTTEAPNEHWETNNRSDLEFIQSLASRCGYTFFIQPGPAPLQSLAYFGPKIPINPIPQPALSVNSDWDTNVESLSFSLDGLSKKTAVLFILDPITGKIPVPLPIPNISLIRPPLGLRLTPPARITFPGGLANLTLDEATNRVFGLLSEGADAVSGSGSLSVSRYGHILHVRSLVGVRGAGLAYDGMYYVGSVTHNIKQGEYKQSFTLSRDGLISQTPVVMP